MPARLLVALIGLALLLAGCVGGPTAHSLSTDDVRAFKLVGVKGAFAAETPSIEWAAAVAAYNKEHPDRPAEIQAFKRSDTGQVYSSISTPEALAHAERAFDARVRMILEPALAAELRGVRPVRAVVTARRIYVPSVGAALVTAALIGGTGRSVLATEIDLVDARTGAPVLRHGPVLVMVDGGDSIIDLGTTGRYSADAVERLLSDMTSRYTQWLLKS